jgi:predicted Zn-dependent peptidase
MKLARKLCLILVASMAPGLGGCILGPKTAEVPSAAIVQYPMRELELPSGMRVLLEQAPDFGIAGAALVVGSGSADESPAEAGLAHLTEHLAFEATHAGVSLAAMRDNLGTTSNAYTGWDQTTFFAFDATNLLADLVGFFSGVARPTRGRGRSAI